MFVIFMERDIFWFYLLNIFKFWVGVCIFNIGFFLIVFGLVIIIMFRFLNVDLL